MTPEKLKLLAEALGYFVEIYTETNKRINIWATKTHPSSDPLSADPAMQWKIFNPESNPAQREEVLLWLLGKGWDLVKVKHKEVYQMEKEDLKKAKVLYVLHEDYTTALMMAAERELG